MPDTKAGISQRDTNFYDYMNLPETHRCIKDTAQTLFDHIQTKWTNSADCKHPSIFRRMIPEVDPLPDTFDILLTRDLSRAHILDFNPYAPRTDPLLFTYDELLAADDLPQLRVIDSRTHPAAISTAPAHAHNMMPLEAISLSSGRDIQEFADLWQDEVRKAVDEE